MPDFEEIFRQALAEHNVEAEVHHTRDRVHDSFCIIKNVGDRQLIYNTAVSARKNVTEKEITKQIAAEARAIAKYFQQELTNIFDVQGRRVEVCTYREAWAKCVLCGNRVELPEQSPSFIEEAEFSTPHPVPKDRESVLNELDGQSRKLLTMYLIGRLRERCGYDCPNHRHNNRDKKQPYKDACFSLDEDDRKIYI